MCAYNYIEDGFFKNDPYASDTETKLHYFLKATHDPSVPVWVSLPPLKLTDLRSGSSSLPECRPLDTSFSRIDSGAQYVLGSSSAISAPRIEYIDKSDNGNWKLTLDVTKVVNGQTYEY